MERGNEKLAHFVQYLARYGNDHFKSHDCNNKAVVIGVVVSTQNTQKGTI